MKRSTLEAKRQKVHDKLFKLQQQSNDINHQLMLLCDDRQWFTEEKETWGKGKVSMKCLRVEFIGLRILKTKIPER